jgi:hypothetical protein
MGPFVESSQSQSQSQSQNVVTPAARPRDRKSKGKAVERILDEEELDELSPEMTQRREIQEQQEEKASPINDRQAAQEMAKRKRGRKRVSQVMPTVEVEELSEDELDELSPEADKTKTTRANQIAAAANATPRSPAVQKAPKVKERAAAAPKAKAPAPRFVAEPQARPGKKRGRPPKVAPAPQAEPFPEPEPELAPPPKTKKRGRPAAPQLSAPSQSQSQSQPTATQSKPKKRRSEHTNEVIPIAIYRLKSQPARKRRRTDVQSPVSDDDSDIDPLSAFVPPTKRNPNPLDVLAQMHSEVLASALDALHEGLERSSSYPSSADRAVAQAAKREFRVKIAAVTAWGEEVRVRLLEMTSAWDAGEELRKRLKAASRERTALRERLLSIRAEREAVALKMDAVREAHEKASRAGEEARQESGVLQDVEVAVGRGRDNGEEGEEKSELDLGVLLEKTATWASSGSQDGGALKRLREFNGFLERVARAIETR